ncbi:MAG: response regulator [Isosphaeraceae bacterium]
MSQKPTHHATDRSLSAAGAHPHWPAGSSDPQARRVVIASLQAESLEFGRPWLAQAFQRLGMMTEVGECLAGSSAVAAAEVAAFNELAYHRLTDVATDDEHEQAAAWVMSESAERWGSYLALLDPDWNESNTSSGSPPEPDQGLLDPVETVEPDAPGSIDASTLFRMLTGSARLPETPHAPAPELTRPAKIAERPQPVPPAPKPAAARPAPRTAPARAPQPAPAQQPASLVIPPPPTSVSIDPELRDTFLEEATDLFERIQSQVLTLSAGQPQPEPLHELGRCLHTLKGAAGSVDLSGLAMLIHAMEEQLEVAAGVPSTGLIDLLHQLLGYIESIFDLLRGVCSLERTPEERWQPTQPAAPPSRTPAPKPASEPPPPRPTPPRVAVAPAPAPVEPVRPSQPVPAQPQPILATPTPPPPAPPPIPAAAVVSKEAPAGEGPVRVTAERIDELMDIASELISRRGLWAAQAETMKDLAHLARTCRTRLVSTIDRIRDLKPTHASPRPGGLFEHVGDLDELIRRLSEQTDDLVVLLESAQATSKPLADNSDSLARQTLLLWESLQAIRIVPVRGLFQRLMRVAHDAARVEGRQVEVVTIGEETGLDRAVQDKAFEPLLHVVRNAVCHGIEPPEERERLGKPAAGRITLEATRSGNTLVLAVHDDGRGLDYEAIAAKAKRLGLLGPDDRPSDDRLSAMIFQAGFSTRDAANSVAGRGVGMDVVSQEVSKLHGSVTLASQKGRGMKLSIALPARLALEQSMVLRVDRQAFALPVELVELAESFEPTSVDTQGKYPQVMMRGESVPLISLQDALGFPSCAPTSCSKVLLIRAEGQPLAVVVEAIDGTRELVIKPMGPLLAGHPLISGVSLSVTGEVVFALNPSGLALWLREGGSRCSFGRKPENGPRQQTTILVVDDSISVRKVVARQLRMLGYDVEEVSDGLEALGKLRNNPYDLVISDLEMPRMDGFELLAELSRLSIAEHVPVLAASTRSDPETRRRVLSLGARDFLPKPIEHEELAEKVRTLLSASAAQHAGTTSPAGATT